MQGEKAVDDTTAGDHPVRIRKTPAARRQEILTAAIRLCARDLFTTLTRDELARRIGVSPGLVGHYWMTMDALRDDVIVEGLSLIHI